MYIKYYSKDNLVRIEELNLTEVSGEVLGDAIEAFDFLTEFYNYNYHVIESLTKTLHKQKGQRYSFDDVALDLEDLTWYSVINFNNNNTTTLNSMEAKAFISAITKSIEAGKAIFDVWEWYKNYKKAGANE